MARSLRRARAPREPRPTTRSWSRRSARAISSTTASRASWATALEPDLALLAGDHLYALGLERLAGLGDLEAVRELADLISLCAVLHADGAADERTTRALWLAAASRGGRRGLRGARDGQGVATHGRRRPTPSRRLCGRRPSQPAADGGLR